MRIAILGSRGVPAAYGGFETFAEFLGVGLVEAGHQVDVYCPHYQAYQESQYKGIQLVHLWHPEMYFKNRNIRAACTIAFDLFSLVRACLRKTDVIYMLGYASGPCLVVPRLLGGALVVNPDGLEWNSARWGRLARGWLYFCEYLASVIPHRIIADAEPIAERFRQKYGAKAVFIPYGTEITQPADAVPIPYEIGSYYISIARMVPETEIPTMIRGFKLSKSRKKMLVVGPTPDAVFFETEVRPLIDNEQVFYLGSIYDRPLLKSLRMGAAALLHGHASEGTNPSLLEGMGCGSPVIAIKRKSNQDVVGSENGLYFEDADALARQITKFEAMSEAERQRMGEGNRARALERYSWASSVKQHLAVFQQLLAPEAIAPVQSK